MSYVKLHGSQDVEVQKQ